MKELEEFCLTSRKTLIRNFFLIYLFVVPIGALLQMGGSEDNPNPHHRHFLPCLIVSAIVSFIIIAVICIRLISKSEGRFYNRIKYLDEHGLLNYAALDVRNGERKFDGCFILGQHCIIGKGNGMIFFYNEINALFIQGYQKKNSDGTTAETLVLKVTAGGEDYTICMINSTEQSDKDWKSVCEYIKNNHDHIEIYGTGTDDLNVMLEKEVLSKFGLQ